jgi:hypothetical protein
MPIFNSFDLVVMGTDVTVDFLPESPIIRNSIAPFESASAVKKPAGMRCMNIGVETGHGRSDLWVKSIEPFMLSSITSYLISSIVGRPSVKAWSKSGLVQGQIAGTATIVPYLARNGAWPSGDAGHCLRIELLDE